MENEIWKDVEGFEKYQISSYGRVRSYYNNKRIYLKQCKNGSGYFFVNLYKNKKQYNVRIHRLVAEAFIPNPNNKPTINHINGDKSNNQVTNLEWVTHKQNIQHGWKTGLMENTRKNIIIANESRKIPVFSSKLNMQFKSCTDAATYIQSNYFEDIKLKLLKTSISRLLTNKVTKSKFDFGWKIISKK